MYHKIAPLLSINWSVGLMFFPPKSQQRFLYNLSEKANKLQWLGLLVVESSIESPPWLWGTFSGHRNQDWSVSKMPGTDTWIGREDPAVYPNGGDRSMKTGGTGSTGFAQARKGASAVPEPHSPLQWDVRKCRKEAQIWDFQLWKDQAKMWEKHFFFRKQFDKVLY